jgi:hypothetical protein
MGGGGVQCTTTFSYEVSSENDNGSTKLQRLRIFTCVLRRDLRFACTYVARMWGYVGTADVVCVEQCLGAQVMV